ncbi:uncharacterized protein LOC115088071 isoform X3 [Rhinatrema bivittatum]|uniref:uncharacterized protein LOC115088071 isoform X3 n=1 Tax=Rhinatrema bivittatum TaxID=194408 RepID=UPI00112DA735|nr:uncharacterized protein LOC115088071 isoform X3 [Rhinatrema bivittatum]
MTDGREPQVTAIKQGRGRLQKEQLLRRGASVSLKRGFAHSGGHEAGRGGQNVRGMRGRAQAPRQPGRKFREEPSQIDLQACGECGHRYSALKNIVVRQRGIRAGFTPGGSRSVHPCSRTGAEALGGERVERDWGAGEGRLPGTGSRAEDTLSTLGGFQGGAVGSYKGNAKQQGLRHDVDWVFSGQDTGGGFSTVAGSEGDVRSKLLRRERWQSRQDKSPGREEAASSFRQDPERMGVKRFEGCAWIVGHFYIHRAQRRAMKRPYGEHLEIDRVRWWVSWFSKRGMGWDELLPFLFEWIQMWGEPNLIIFHLGGNDIGSKTCRELLTCMKKDLSQVMIRCPRVLLGWSDIIVRLRNKDETIWRVGVKKLNRQLGKWMGWEGGFWIRHQWSWGNEAGLFSGDGVHLSEVGMDLFNNSLQEGLEKEIRKWYLGRSGGGQTDVSQFVVAVNPSPKKLYVMGQFI